MLKFTARVYFRTADEGGLTNPAFSGIQPSIEIAGDLVACRIFCGEEGTEMALGEKHDVQLALAYESKASAKLEKNFHFGLNVGGRVIGGGVIT